MFPTRYLANLLKRLTMEYCSLMLIDLPKLQHHQALQSFVCVCPIIDIWYVTFGQSTQVYLNKFETKIEIAIKQQQNKYRQFV